MIELLKEIEQQREESITRTIFDEFAKRTNKVWTAINKLAEAQKKTELELKELIKEYKRTREILGGLSDAVGYSLGDRAIKNLPSLLKEKYSIEVTDKLVRRFVKYNGRTDELNIFGKGIQGGREIYILVRRSQRFL